MSQTIFFVGGGTLGHIVPSLAVYEALERQAPGKYVPLFLCSQRGDDIRYLQENHIPHLAFNLPKPNLSLFLPWNAYRWVYTFVHCLQLFLKERPACIFSKGGYVSVLPSLVAYCCRIPVVLHESDAVFGHANRFLARLARHICCGFLSASRQVPRAVHTGNPIRALQGDRLVGQRITGFLGEKPVLCVLGGSQGSLAINEALQNTLPSLLHHVDIIHITGRGKPGAAARSGYFSCELVLNDMPHLLSLADIFLSRAGAGTLAELASLGKPVILVPLAGVAHDHQVANAKSLEVQGAIILLPQEKLSTLSTVVLGLLRDSGTCRALGQKMANAFPKNAAEKIASLLLSVAK